MNIVIIGGGNASLVLIDYFQSIDYIKLKGVFDVKDSAPGIVRAKQLGVATYGDIKVLANMPDIDTVIEVTGNDNVKKTIIDQLKPNQHFMSSNAAKIMTDFIEVQNRRRFEATEKISENFNNLTFRLKSSEEYISQSIRKIEAVLLSMKIVSMNARIEAARAGESGRAFEVVVSAMQSTLNDIETALHDIMIASDESKSTMADLVQTEDKLKESLNIH